MLELQYQLFFHVIFWEGRKQINESKISLLMWVFWSKELFFSSKGVVICLTCSACTDGHLLTIAFCELSDLFGLRWCIETPALTMPGVLWCKKKPVVAAESPKHGGGTQQSREGWQQEAAEVSSWSLPVLLAEPDQLLWNYRVSPQRQCAPGYWNHTAVPVAIRSQEYRRKCKDVIEKIAALTGE